VLEKKEKIMYVAYDDKDRVCNALDTDIEKNNKYHCPVCGEKVIFKKGVKVQSHFAHVKNCSCDYETYKKESKEHLEAKKDLYNHFRSMYKNVEVEHVFKVGEGNIQIADVFIRDKNIAFEYAKLCESEEVQAIYYTILDEWQLTKNVILAIEGYDELLAENTYLKDSLNYRMPYFNVLNYIQLELIKRQRRGELSSDEERLIHTTINGIATGLRNSG